MKNWKSAIVGAAVAMLAGSAATIAITPTVHCDGDGCGEVGPQTYTYRVESVGYPMMQFRVGTEDLNPLHYTEVLIPPGWHFTIDTEPMMHWHDGATPHGELSLGPCRCPTKGSARWWTNDPANAIQQFTFGFNHPWAPHDVGFDLTARRPGPPPKWYLFEEFWDSPVGSGDGPVHGPLAPFTPMQLGAEEIVNTDEGNPIKVLGYSVPSFIDWNSDGSDDLVIGEGGAGYPGKVRVYLNTGSVSQPGFTNDWFYAQSNGQDLEVPGSGCLGAFPRMVDWNENSHKDLIIGLADGHVMWFANIGTSVEPTFDAGTYLQVGPTGNKVDIAVGARATPTVFDWNEDGRKDLVVGAIDGRIRIYINEGTNADPDFLIEIRAQAHGSDLLVPTGRSSPFVVDFDVDGRKDLVCGNTEGQLVLYRNIGTDDWPEFGDHEFVESDGMVIDLPLSPRSRPSVCDWTRDYLLDVLIGSADGKVRLYQGVPVPLFTLSIDPMPLVADADAFFMIDHGKPSSLAALAYSLRGYGSTYFSKLGVTLDLRNPKQAGELVMTDPNGSATWLLHVPANATDQDILLQAVQYQKKTNVVDTWIVK